MPDNSNSIEDAKKETEQKLPRFVQILGTLGFGVIIVAVIGIVGNLGSRDIDVKEREIQATATSEFRQTATFEARQTETAFAVTITPTGTNSSTQISTPTLFGTPTMPPPTTKRTSTLPSPAIVTPDPAEAVSPKPETTELTPTQPATSSPSPVFTSTPTIEPTLSPTENVNPPQIIFRANNSLLDILETPPADKSDKLLKDFLGYWCGQHAQDEVLDFIDFQHKRFPEGFTSITFEYEVDENKNEFKISFDPLQIITVETQEYWRFSSAKKTRCSIVTYIYTLIPEGNLGSYCIGDYDFIPKRLISEDPLGTRCP